MPTLLELSDAIDLELALDTAETEEEKAARIEQYFKDGEINQKIDNYAALIRELELRAEVRKGEAERILNRSKIDLNKAQFLKDKLVIVFKNFQIKTLETVRFRVTLGASGKLPVILSTEISSLPENYIKQIITIKADLEKIAEDLEAGVIIDGVCFGERKESIRIK